MEALRRLEQTLVIWEDRFFVDGLFAERGWLGLEDSGRKIPYVGALRNSGLLRAHLLAVGSGETFDRSLFEMHNTDMLEMYGEGVLSLPRRLANWTSNSRRIFQMTRELQALLSGMSMDNITWSEILLPFDTFMIALPQPIYVHEKHFDAILVDMERGDDDHLSLALYSTALSEYRPLSSYDKAQWRKSVHKQSASLITRRAEFTERTNLLGILSCVCTAYTSLLNTKKASSTITIQDQILGDGSSKDAVDAYGEAFRLVAALCLYLTCLPVGSPHSSGWHAPPRLTKNRDPRAISDRAQVCEVKSMFTLTAEEQDIYLAPSMHPGHMRQELSSKMVRGHFRRPPGKGDDPTAKKTVTVKPYPVRVDRLGPGEMQGGSLTILK